MDGYIDKYSIYPEGYSGSQLHNQSSANHFIKIA